MRSIADELLVHTLLKDRQSTREFLKADTMDTMTPEGRRSIDEVLRRVQGEFLEMPGLRVTEPQARRLWGLDAVSCQALLDALVDAKFLFRTKDGAFMRADHASTARAAIRRRPNGVAA